MPLNELPLWALFFAVGAGTFAIRVSFIELYGRLLIPAVVNRALAYVPASVLAALVLPAVILAPGSGEFSPENPRVLAGGVAALVAWASRNTLLTLAAGMGSLWGLQFMGW